MSWEELLSLVFVWGLVALSAGCFALGLWSLSWPSVKGTINVSILDSDRDNSERETFELCYSYVVNGQKFIGSNIKPWGNSNATVGTGDDTDGFYQGRTLWSAAREAARWYRPGVTVDVYYCPLRPQWCCLEPGGFLFPLFLAAVGGCLLFFLR